MLAADGRKQCLFCHPYTGPRLATSHQPAAGGRALQAHGSFGLTPPYPGGIVLSLLGATVSDMKRELGDSRAEMVAGFRRRPSNLTWVMPA